MTKIINTNLPSGQQLREYLVKHGWTLAQHDAYLDSALAPAPWDSVRFLVPTRDDFEDYQYRLAQTLRNLSIIEQRPVMVILNEMGHLGNIYDKIRFTIMAIGLMACDLGPFILHIVMSGDFGMRDNDPDLIKVFEVKPK